MKETETMGQMETPKQKQKLNVQDAEMLSRYWTEVKDTGLTLAAKKWFSF